jgi:nucleoid DNA-binding protein
MDRRGLVTAAARRSSLSREQMRDALDALLGTVAEALAGGETVAIASFGRFETQVYPGRKLRRFGGPGHYAVEERRVPVFRSSAVLRRRLREES